MVRDKGNAKRQRLRYETKVLVRDKGNGKTRRYWQDTKVMLRDKGVNVCISRGHLTWQSCRSTEHKMACICF